MQWSNLERFTFSFNLEHQQDIHAVSRSWKMKWASLLFYNFHNSLQRYSLTEVVNSLKSQQSKSIRKFKIVSHGLQSFKKFTGNLEPYTLLPLIYLYYNLGCLHFFPRSQKSSTLFRNRYIFLMRHKLKIQLKRQLKRLKGSSGLKPQRKHKLSYHTNTIRKPWN